MTHSLQEHEPPTVEADALKTLKVLVADDSPVYRKLIEHTLRDHSYEPVLAKSGSEALKLFADHLPPIMVTDWLMPDLTGIDLCKTIRSSYTQKYTYIIILTSIAEKGGVVKGLAAGADDYLTKPFDSGELLARIGVGRRVADLRAQIDAKNRLLEELALTDPLTGLPNRRSVEDWTTRQLCGASRHDFPVWVVMADIDHFKSINDSFGHAAGDQVIKEFAGILKANVRSSDICARIGGEEFVIVFTHIGLEGVITALERVRREVESRNFDAAGQITKVTASFGIAGLKSPKGVDFHTLLGKADGALYSAKKNGRNRIELASGLIA